MNAWYICSSKVLIITSPGLLLKFTDIKCLHPLCAKIFRPITLKKLLSYIMLADSEHAKNNLISSLVKKDLAALLPTAAFSSLIFHWFIKIYFEVLKIIIFSVIFCYGTLFINCNETPCWTKPLIKDCPLADIEICLWQKWFGTCS